MRTHAQGPKPTGRGKAAAAPPARRELGAPSALGNQALQQLLRSEGRRLPDSERDFFEPRLGTDLGAVRIHDDPQAAHAASQLEARAFTVGNDIAFGARQFQPATAAGRKLIAHELAHTLQQTQAPTIQRSAVAYFEEAGFKEQAAVARDSFEATLPYETRLTKGIRKRRLARFDRRMELVDSARYADTKEEIGRDFADTPRKRDRKLKRLEKRRDKAESKVRPFFPQLKRILVIQVTYHYLEEPKGQLYRFDPEVLEEVKKKFRVGQVWPDLDWKGEKGPEKIGVRFAIRFEKHADLAKAPTGETAGDARMVRGAVEPNNTYEKIYDLTGDKAVISHSGEKLAATDSRGMMIDTEAMQRTKQIVWFHPTELERAEGRQPEEKRYPPDPEQIKPYMASVIAHEIGHNIGMIHADNYVMSDQKVSVLKTATRRNEGEEEGEVKHGIRNEVTPPIYSSNDVDPWNVQCLVNRIQDMTREGKSFWKAEKLRKGLFGPKAPVDNSGITVLVDPNSP